MMTALFAILSAVVIVNYGQTLTDIPFTLKFTGMCQPHGGSPPTSTICHLNATSQTRDSIIEGALIKDNIFSFGNDVISLYFNATFLSSSTLWDVGYFTVDGDQIFFESLQPSTNVDIPGLAPGQQGTGMWNLTGGTGAYQGAVGTCTIVGVGTPFNNNDNVYLYITSILWSYV